MIVVDGHGDHVCITTHRNGPKLSEKQHFQEDWGKSFWVGVGLNIFHLYTLYIEQHIKTYNNNSTQMDSEESLQTYTNLYPI